MFRDLLPLIAVLTVAALVYAVREIRRRQSRIVPPMPEITLAETWEHWRHGARNPYDDEFVRRPIGQPARAAVEELLTLAASACAEADNPRLALRQAILEQAVIALHLEAVPGFAEEERSASTLACLVLRLHARLKYDDAVPDDWFHNFARVAGPYIREKTRLARESVVRRDEGTGRIVEIYDQLLAELRKDMIRTRPKKRFVPPDIG